MTDLRVHYKSSVVEKTDTYPIFRFPKKGTVVRSHRFGKCIHNSACFSNFKYEVEQVFGCDYIVSSEVRMNTGSVNRPFDLDLALLHRKDPCIRINIEIDEPYASFSREAKHCDGDDTLRDDYFLERGWMVLRFSESQVHQLMGGCLRFVSECLKGIDPNFEPPPVLLSYSPLKNQPLWNLVQAQKWEKASYRESYINRDLPAVQENNRNEDRLLNANELKEEKSVVKSFFGKMELIKDHRNRHVRDERVQFNSEQHKYFIDGIPSPSVSTVIGRFFPEFDSFGAAKGLRPSNPLYGMSPNKIVDIWHQKGKDASDKGTELHEQIEHYYLGDAYDKVEGFELFERFAKEHSSLEPYRCEWRVFDEEFHVAGTIDFIAKNHDIFEMYDWKRSKKVIEPLSGDPIQYDRWGKKGVGKLASIDDTSFNRYSLQQSLYRVLVEKNYGIQISHMFLVVIHPEYDRYYKIEVPYLKNYANYILNTL